MELCLLNLLLLIDCCLCNSYPCVLFESLSHVINQESHFYSWNLEKGYLVSLGRFQNSKKVNSVNLSQISLLNMWLLVLIIRVIKIDIASLTVLFWNCPLLKNISVNTKCILVWCDWPVVTCLVRVIFKMNHPCDFWKFWNCLRFTRAVLKFSKMHSGSISQIILGYLPVMTLHVM